MTYSEQFGSQLHRSGFGDRIVCLDAVGAAFCSGLISFDEATELRDKVRLGFYVAVRVELRGLLGKSVRRAA